MLLFISELTEAFRGGWNDQWKYFFDTAWDYDWWANPYLTYIFCCVFVFGLEIVLPKKKNYPLLDRKGFWQDLFYVFFTDYVIFPIGLFASLEFVEEIMLIGMEGMGVELTPVPNGTRYPPLIIKMYEQAVWVQILVLFILTDLAQFIGHYLLHVVPWFWRVHKIHHAQETLGFASTRHFHFAEYIVFNTVLYIPFYMIGYDMYIYLSVHLWINYFFATLSHANIKVPWSALNYVFITPDTHFWHHAKNVKHKYGVNFASVLPIWDMIIGTFYLPKDKEPELGIHNDDVPKTFLGQLVYPFVSPFQKSDAHNDNFHVTQTRKQKRQQKGRK